VRPFIVGLRNIKLNKMRFERKITVLSLLGGLVGILMALALLWTSSFQSSTKLSLTILMLGCWIGFALSVKNKVAFPLRTILNLIGALREGDYSMRLRGAGRDDAMGELAWEVNRLVQFLQKQRFDAVESTALLRKILAEIDVALFGFDSGGVLQWVNDSGQRLLKLNNEKIIGRHAKEFGLDLCLGGSVPRIVDLSLPGGVGRWELRRATYREKGLSHQLVFLSDMTRTLHEEQRQAWRRLIQILRHEINNSLTPIQSVAQSLQTSLKQDPRSENWEDDVREGLEIIAERSEVLGDFIASYSRLTRLPDPTFAGMNVETWIRHVAGLETRLSVEITRGPELTIQADRSQLEQLLINIVSNAVEASLQTKRQADGYVMITWKIAGAFLEVWVDDDGPGFDMTKDPFVPFYTTKPEGSGIGLALSRQIAEAHGGYLTLTNHSDRPGCLALLRLPLEQTL
jgi:two-component system nitrogen regulation sensor histidine kinase NtrY